ESFHDTGVGAKEGRPEPGRAAITKDDADLGRFKTPTLRMVALTAPYMHDGSLATLNDVLEFYKRGGNPTDHLDPLLKPVDLSEADVGALNAFPQGLPTRRPAAPTTCQPTSSTPSARSAWSTRPSRSTSERRASPASRRSPTARSC